MIVLSPFTKTYLKRRVLSFPGLSLEQGKIYAVIGANGSGKSTLARVLSGTETADGGTVPQKGASVGFMPQKSFAFRGSVLYNVLLGGGEEEKALRLLGELSLLSLKDASAKTLSGGEAARMALARVLMKRFDLLILDEPCASMDMEGTLLAEKCVRDYAEKEKAAVILITHSLAQAARLADETLFFKQGELIEHGETARLLSSPQHPETEEFLRFFRG